MKPVVLLIALAVAVVRPFFVFYEVGGHLQSSYEAMAHIFVGGLFGAYLANKKVFGYMLWAGIGLTLVEIICAVATVLYK